jgi:uncharacterized protein YbjQ (UPF0145 family)
MRNVRQGRFGEIFMKFARTSLIAMAFCATAFAASPANAQRHRGNDTPTNFSIEQARQQPDFASSIEGVRFYFGSQGHPAIAQRLERDAMTSQRASSRHKTPEESCGRAFLNALVSLRNHALQQGGNAVVNVRSNWNHVEFSSTSEFQCVRGRMMSGVALKGDIVRLR